MTLLRAVASAKGLTEFAKEEDVVILRTVEGRRMAGLYNIESIRRGLYDDPAIYANDLVVVGDSPQRRLFRDFIAVTPLLFAFWAAMNPDTQSALQQIEIDPQRVIMMLLIMLVVRPRGFFGSRDV